MRPYITPCGICLVIGLWVGTLLQGYSAAHPTGPSEVTQPTGDFDETRQTTQDISFLQKTPAVGWLRLDDITVSDGDTLIADVHFPWNITLNDESIRCLGYDACETSKRRRTVEVTDAEIVKGKQAKTELENLIVGADVYIRPETQYGSRDPYGRLLGYVMVVRGTDEILLHQWMAEKGYCR